MFVGRQAAGEQTVVETFEEMAVFMMGLAADHMRTDGMPQERSEGSDSESGRD